MDEFKVCTYYVRIITHLIDIPASPVYSESVVIGKTGSQGVALKLEENYCTLCGAVVPRANQLTHNEWHRKIHESLLPPY